MDASEQEFSSGGGLFSTTQWSIVLAAGDSRNPEADKALTALFETYWYPVYGRIRQTHFGIDDARDLTQGFFVRSLFYPGKQLGEYRGEFFKRLVVGYLVTLSVAIVLLGLIDKGPFEDWLLAVKRAVLIAFPASFAATAVDYMK